MQRQNDSIRLNGKHLKGIHLSHLLFLSVNRLLLLLLVSFFCIDSSERDCVVVVVVEGMAKGCERLTSLDDLS